MIKDKLKYIITTSLVILCAMQTVMAMAVTTGVGGPGSEGQVMLTGKKYIPYSENKELDLNDDAYSEIKIINSEFKTLKANAVSKEVGIVYDTEEHSIDDVMKKWKEINVNNFGLNYYADYVNFSRYLSDLPKVKMDSELNLKAQDGAVLLDKSGEFSHYPKKPNGMSDEFYKTALSATSSSNLSGQGGVDGIKACLDDTNNALGYGNLGHRMALLTSDLEYIGFGEGKMGSLQYVDTTDHYDGDENIFHNNPRPRYICWPSKGAFPSNLIGKSTIWSISLNHYDYNNTSSNKDELAMANASVKITRLSDNKVWNLPKVDHLDISQSGFEHQGYVELHIAPNDLGASNYTGKYKVELNNVKNRNGKFENISYTIDFFDQNKIKSNGQSSTISVTGVSASWKHDDKGWRYTEGNTWAKGWRHIDGKWYYFYDTGYMASNTTIGGYYFSSSGAWTN